LTVGVIMDNNLINIKEFIELGYLQELNRKFLHPLGLCLEIETTCDDGEEFECNCRIQDRRYDPLGCMISEQRIKEDRKQFKTKEKYINREIKTRKNTRREMGYKWIQKI
jgi:hypothetical protein